MEAAEASASASAPDAAQPSPHHVHSMILDEPVAANGEIPDHTATHQQRPQMPAKATPSLGKRRGRASESEMAAANKDLIVSGKRSRRKVDKSADFLLATPKAAKNDEAKRKRSFSKPVVSETEAVSVEDGEPMRPTASEQENAAKRERLAKRKSELEAYLRRLQVALAAERRRVGVGVAEAESIAATALPGGDRRGPVQRRRSTGASKARKTSTKTTSAAPARPLKDVETHLVDTPEAETGMSASTLKLCLRVVDDLLHNQHGDIFATAVDWKALNIPTYPQIVKNPMDLGTVRSRLTSGFYSGLDAFASDIQLIWDNAKLFNAPKSFVHEATLEMDRIWQRKYANLMREKRRASKALQSASLSAEPAAVAPPPPKPSSKPRPKPKTKATAPPTKAKTSTQVDHLQPMSLEEKAKLRADLMNLPTHHIGPVLAIMRESAAASATESQEEIEIDVSALDTATARKLQHYMKSVHPSRPNSRPASGHRKSRTNDASTPAVQSGSDSESDLYSDSDTSSSSGFADLSSDEDGPEAAAAAAGAGADLGTTAHAPAAAPLAPPPASVDAKAASHANSSAPEQFEKMDTRPEDQSEDVHIENTDAWSSLTKNSEQEASSAPEKTGDAALWSDYKTKDALNRQRERELVEQEGRRRAELQRLEAERAEREKRLLAEREADEARRKQEAEERERARLLQLEQEREAARRAREQEEEVDDQAGAVEEFQNLMSA